MKAIQILSFVVAILLLSACKTTKVGSQNPQDLTDLKKAVNQLVDCLNQRDEACVTRLYAQDFESYSPLIEFSSVEQLVAKTINNFESNRFQVSINIIDLEVGTHLAYVVLEWELMEQRADGVWLSLLLEKRLDLWKKNQELGWQLQRSLFYKPKFY